MCRFHQCPDAAAVGMSQHHDLLHFQSGYCELQCRTCAVIVSLSLVWRHQVGHVTDDKNLLWLGVKQDGGINA